MTRAQSAKNYFTSGYNCSQAVMLAFASDTGADEKFIKAVSLPMGGGIGRLRETCGGVTGAIMSMGLLFPEMNKSEMYALVQEFARRFREKNGSYNCGELLTGAGVKAERTPDAEARTPAYYQKRPCAELVADAAELLEEMCRERGRL